MPVDLKLNFADRLHQMAQAIVTVLAVINPVVCGALLSGRYSVGQSSRAGDVASQSSSLGPLIMFAAGPGTITAVVAHAFASGFRKVASLASDSSTHFG
jgi:hypothetical protein